jgi:hypothetical protein
MDELMVRLLNWVSPRIRGWVPSSRPPAADVRWPLGHACGSAGERERQPVWLTEEELDRHTLLLGGTGTGKTTTIEHLVTLHLERSSSFCLVDPHGDLTNAAIEAVMLRTRRKRDSGSALELDRVYLLEGFREDAIVGINVLDPGEGALYPHILSLVGVLRRMWSSSWGPRMEEILRNGLLALASADLTFAELPAFLTDPGFRARVVARVPDEPVRDFWTERFARLSSAAQTAACEPVRNKIESILTFPTVRCVLGQAEGAISLRRLMDEGAYVLFNGSRGQLGEASTLLGSFLVAMIQTAALARADQEETSRRRFSLIVDEFQHFRTDEVETILSEARKYRLRLIMAHQHGGQVPSNLQNGIAANTATSIFFRLSPSDAAAAVRLLPEGSLAPSVLTQLPVGQAVVCRRGRAAVRTQMQRPERTGIGREELLAFAVELRRRHGRARSEIESEMRRRRERFGDPPAPAAGTTGKKGRGGRSRAGTAGVGEPTPDGPAGGSGNRRAPAQEPPDV